MPVRLLSFEFASEDVPTLFEVADQRGMSRLSIECANDVTDGPLDVLEREAGGVGDDQTFILDQQVAFLAAIAVEPIQANILARNQ